MKFSCDSCSAQYQISSEKLGPRGAKVRCKRCGHMIIVRPEPVPVTAAATASPAVPSEDILAAQTSSEFGSSTEMAALGFETGAAPRSGGSLDDVDQTLPDPAASAEPAGSEEPMAATQVMSPPDAWADSPPASALEEATMAVDAARVAERARAADAAAVADEGVSAAADGLDLETGFDAAGPSTRVEERPDWSASDAQGSPFERLAQHEPAGFAVEDPAEPAVDPEVPVAEAEDPLTLGNSAPEAEMELERAEPNVTAEPEEEAPSPRAEAPTVEEAAPPESATAAEFPDSADEDFEAGSLAALAAMAPRPSAEEAVEDEGERPAPAFAAPDDAEASALLEDIDGRSSPLEDEPGLVTVGSSKSDEEIGSAFAAMFGSEPPRPAEALEPADASQDEAPAAEAPPALPPAGASVPVADWYIAIDHEQVGPLTRAEVEAKWTEGAIDGESLCWKQGMPDWTAIERVDELAGLLEQPSERPSPTSGAAFGVAAPMTGEVRPAIVLQDASRVGDPTERSSGGWRPSAASALASLAAEELDGGETSSPAPKPTTAKMTAIPTASNELSRLLEGTDTRREGTASMFGVGEKSVSKVRAIPKRSESLDAAPLVDAPAVESPWKRYGILAAGALVLLLVGGVAQAMFFGGGTRDEPAKPSSGSAPVAAAPPPAPKKVVPAPAPVPEPALPAESPEPVAVAETATEDAGTADPVQPPAAAPAPLPAKALLATAEPVAEPEVEEEEPEPAPKPTKKRRKRRTRRKKRSPSRTPAKVAPAPAPEPPKPVAQRTRQSSVEDLLGAAPPSRVSAARAEPKLPTKLDDVDVLRVLKKHRAQVRDCIDKHERADGDSGTVKVTITIRPSGNVSSTRFSPASFQGSVLGRCLASNARTWRFPKFAGEPTPVDFPVRVK